MVRVQSFRSINVSPLTPTACFAVLLAVGLQCTTLCSILKADTNVPRLIQTAQPAEKKKTVTANAKKPAAAPAAAAPVEAGSKQPAFSLAFVPRDVIAVAAIRPADLLRKPGLAPLVKSLTEQGAFKKELGISLDRIEQALVVVIPEQVGGPGFNRPAVAGFILHIADASDAAELGKFLVPKSESQEYGGQTYYRSAAGRGTCYLIADGRTVVISESEEHLHRLIVAGSNGASKAKWIKEWPVVSKADAAVVVNMPRISDSLNREMQIPGNPLGGFTPLWTNVQTGVCGLTFNEQLTLSGQLLATSKEDTKKVKGTLSAAVTLAQNSLSGARQAASRVQGEDGAMMLASIDLADSFLDSLAIAQDDDKVLFEASLATEEGAKMFAMLLPAIQKSRAAARRSQAMNNLKQIGLAMHNYHDVFNSFPPAALLGSDGKTKHSWRVAILPFLDQAALYNAYKMDEPWDSENNKKVLAKMPAVFRDPAAPADSTDSIYYTLTGEATVFSGDEGSKIQTITDGTSNTIMVVEAKRDIPWTKPDDIVYDPEKELPKLGGIYEGGMHVLMCDGAVRFVSDLINEGILRALISKNGGEVIGDF